MTLLAACGAECQGTASFVAAPHWSSATGTVAVGSSVVRSGQKSYTFDAAATRPFIARTFAASQTYAYLRGFFRVTDATPASDTCIARIDCSATDNFTLYVKTTGVLEASFVGNAPQTLAGLADNTWYGVELEVNISANPHVVKWRTNSAGTWTDRTNVSYAVAADTFSTTGWYVGEIAEGPTSALTIYWDDLVVASGTASEHYSTTPNASPCTCDSRMGAMGFSGVG